MHRAAILWIVRHKELILVIEGEVCAETIPPPPVGGSDVNLTLI